MSRSSFLSSLCLVLCMFLLAACNTSPWTPPPGDESGEGQGTIPGTGSITKTVAILVVDYYAEQPLDGGGAASTPAASTIPENCLTDVSEQVYWITWVVGEIVSGGEAAAGSEAAAAGNHAPDNVGHGDIVFSELADQLSAQLTPDNQTPFDGSQLIYHQGAHQFLVRRVPVAGYTTQAVADSIGAAVETLRGEGITDIVINMSFALLPCVEPALARLTADELVNVEFATINTLPQIEVADHTLPSPLARYLNSQLVYTLQTSGVKIDNYEQLFPAPTLDQPIPSHPYAPLSRSKLEGFVAPEANLTFDGLDQIAGDNPALRIDDAAHLFGPAPADAGLYFPGGLPPLAYETAALEDAEWAVEPEVRVPSPDLVNLALNARAFTFETEPTYQLPVTWTLTLPATDSPDVVIEQLNTAPALAPLRVLAAYTDRNAICSQFSATRSDALDSYCAEDAYVQKINDPGAATLTEDPLYQLLAQLHNDPELRVISVAAAGNFSATYPFAPASWPQVISVGAPGNPYFISNGAEVQMPGIATLKSVLLGKGEIAESQAITVAGTSFAAPLLSVLAARYLADDNALDCAGAGGATSRPPLNYATWDANSPPNYGNWENLTLKEARDKYCALFPEK